MTLSIVDVIRNVDRMVGKKEVGSFEPLPFQPSVLSSAPKLEGVDITRMLQRFESFHADAVAKRDAIKAEIDRLKIELENTVSAIDAVNMTIDKLKRYKNFKVEASS